MDVLIFQRDERSIRTDLPELLGCILASHALENLCAAWVLIHELGDVVDGVVDDDVHAVVGAVVGGHVGRGEGLGHGGFERGGLG